MGSKMQFPGHGCLHEKTKKVRGKDAQGFPIKKITCRDCGDVVGIESTHRPRKERGDKK